MNGTPGDHPLTDIFVYGLAVYGEEADGLIRRIRGLCSERELHEWWDEKVAWSEDRDLVLGEVRAQHATLLERAHSQGWEVDEEA